MGLFNIGIVFTAYRNFSTKGFPKPSFVCYSKYKSKDKKTSTRKIERRPKVQWTEEQKSVLSYVSQGKSVFITGAAGTGKTKLVTEIVKLLKKLHTPSNVFVTASTGVAAFAIKGQTLHSFAGIRYHTDDPKILYERIKSCKSASRRWQKAKALVIDEISMVDARLFDNLENVARQLRGVDEKWGGIQLVVVGDFCQLPPIPNDDSISVKYAFEADCWNQSFDFMIELTIILRQSDPRFIKLLEGIRMGESDPEGLSFLNSYCSKNNSDLSTVQLFPRKQNVKKVNEERLKSLQNPVVVYRALDHGAKTWTRQLNHGIAPDEVSICVGARVMLVKNLCTWKGLVNGATGTVVKLVKSMIVGSVCPDQLMPIVKFDSGKVLEIEPEEWHIMVGNKIVATRKQIPLILAWALSIHKCQGMTLDKAYINLSRAFGCGMVYTSLSRLRSMDGLHLSGFTASKILADPKVSEFYRSFTSQRNNKDQDISCTKSTENSSSTITCTPEKAITTVTERHFSLHEFLARRSLL